VIVTCHQPDLLPYSGFWYKMAHADMFDIKIYDQFVDRGYQRRVKMRDRWASIPIISGKWHDSILNVRIDPPTAREALINNIVGRYRGAKHWERYGPVVIDMVTDIHTNRLWQFNLELILGIRDLLQIDTPVSISTPLTARGADGVLSMLQRYDTTTYLSGTGARAYMGDCRQFTEAGIDVVFSPHRPVTGDSILTVLMDYDEPMDVVLAEHDADPEEESA
jgi:hypothetical protein